MSKKWYPVIDIDKCIGCGSCVAMCNHGVYDKSKSPEPFVIFGEGCITGCKGCSNICPVGAIEYIGDTYREPSACSCGNNVASEENDEDSCGCGSGCNCGGKC